MNSWHWQNSKKMIEIELKFQIHTNQINKLIGRLQKLGFTVATKRTYEKTVMYDNPQNLMLITDGRVRLRQSGDKIEFSYKKPITREGIKQEIEYEVVVSNFAEMENILEAMEFSATTSYERYRKTFMPNTKVKITLDEYPYATFLEIEGGEKEIKAMARELGFNLKNNLTKPCDTLFTEWRKERGLSMKPHMRFADWDK
jgi:adenylate cyclase class 2